LVVSEPDKKEFDKRKGVQDTRKEEIWETYTPDEPNLREQHGECNCKPYAEAPEPCHTCD
jgi:hypothetical protein